VTRKIPKHPYKVLDAPNLQDDFYLNLVDWSPLNYIGVGKLFSLNRAGLENTVYIWSACNSKVNKLCEMPENDMVCSVSWSQRGNHIACGNSYGEIQIYDVAKSKMLRSIDGHQGRIGTAALVTPRLDLLERLLDRLRLEGPKHPGEGREDARAPHPEVLRTQAGDLRA
jgi:cell division cycle 20-like protein 1 (cofactor of APC complex)